MGKRLRWGHFFDKLAGCKEIQLYQNEALPQVFPCEFNKIFINTFFNRTPLGNCFYLLQIYRNIPFKYSDNRVKLDKLESHNTKY